MFPFRFYSLFCLLVLFFVGCGSSYDGSAVSGQAPATPTGPTGTVRFQFVLARAVPSSVTEIRFSGYDETDAVLYGPRVFPKAPVIELTGVPVAVTKIRGQLLIGSVVSGEFLEPVSVVEGGSVTIADPAFDVALTGTDPEGGSIAVDLSYEALGLPDSNQNGIRDDLEELVNTKYNQSDPQRRAMLFLARLLTSAITNHTDEPLSLQTANNLRLTLDASRLYFNSLEEWLSAVNELEAMAQRSTQVGDQVYGTSFSRFLAYKRFNDHLDGTDFRIHTDIRSALNHLDGVLPDGIFEEPDGNILTRSILGDLPDNFFQDDGVLPVPLLFDEAHPLPEGEFRTALYYGNGVGNSWLQSFASLIYLKHAVETDPRFPDQMKRDIIWGLSFNPTQGTGQDVLQTIAQIGESILSYRQASFAERLISSGPITSVANLINANFGDDDQVAGDSRVEVKLHADEYKRQLDLGRRVIVVAHSQGNLYANLAYDQIDPDRSNKYFRIVSVGNPDFRVGGDTNKDTAPYVTVDNDLIIHYIVNNLVATVLDVSVVGLVRLGSGLTIDEGLRRLPSNASGLQPRITDESFLFILPAVEFPEDYLTSHGFIEEYMNPDPRGEARDIILTHLANFLTDTLRPPSLSEEPFVRYELESNSSEGTAQNIYAVSEQDRAFVGGVGSVVLVQGYLNAEYPSSGRPTGKKAERDFDNFRFVLDPGTYYVALVSDTERDLEYGFVNDFSGGDQDRLSTSSARLVREICVPHRRPVIVKVKEFDEDANSNPGSYVFEITRADEACGSVTLLTDGSNPDVSYVLSNFRTVGLWTGTDRPGGSIFEPSRIHYDVETIVSPDTEGPITSHSFTISQPGHHYTFLHPSLAVVGDQLITEDHEFIDPDNFVRPTGILPAWLPDIPR